MWVGDSTLGALTAPVDIWKCVGILLGFSPPHFFWLSPYHGELLVFGGRQDDEHPVQGTSASSKMLRNTEEKMKWEARVPHEGKELGTPLP